MFRTRSPLCMVLLSAFFFPFVQATAWGGDLRVATTIPFSALDGGPDDEDGVADGILTVSRLTLIGTGRIVVDVATADFNVAGRVMLVGSGAIGPDPNSLPITGPTITIVSGGSVLMAGTSTINADGVDAGGAILVCAGGDIDIGGLAAAIASSASNRNGVGGSIVLQAGGRVMVSSGRGSVRANGGTGGQVELLSCADDLDIVEDPEEDAGFAVLIRGKVQAIGSKGEGGSVGVTARHGGIDFQNRKTKIDAGGKTEDGTVTLTAATSVVPDPPPTKPAAATTTGVVSNDPCVCSVVVTIESPENLTLTNETGVDVSGTVVSSFDIVSVSVNGVPAVVTGETFSVPGIPLSEGTNTLSALVLDSAGFVGTANVQVVRDTTPPTVVITSPQNDTKVFSPEISVSGIVNDTIVGVLNASPPAVEVAGTPVAVMNNAFVAPSVVLVPGINVIPVTATDQAGNVGNTSVQVKFDDEAISKIEVFGGNNQSAQIGQALPQPLVARLLDELGNPVPNGPVIFKVTQNNGAFTDDTRLMLVTTDAQGLASADLIVGTRSGEGCNRVEAASVGFAGKAIFLATSVGGPAGKINVSMGTPQKGLVNSLLPEPLAALVTDDSGNPVPDLPVTFQVLAGGGRFAESQSDTFVLNTDVAGRVAATMILGPDEGIENNIVEASVQGLGALPAVFVASGVTPGNPADTTFSGVVLDNSDVPIPGVTMHIEDTELTTATDEEGQFFLSGVPVGPIRLVADGSTTTRPGTWPTLEFDIVTIAGVDNTLGMPIYLLPLVEGVPLAGGDNEVALTLAEVPGFEMRVLPNSTHLPCGQTEACTAEQCAGGLCKTPVQVSVTQVHSDKIPMTPMDGLQPRFIITIQPAIVHFDPPAPICLPNADGLTPGEMTNMYSFDHDLGRFVVIGPGTVTEDGSVICSDPGFGIVKGGWHCAGPSNPQGFAQPATCTITNVDCNNEDFTFTATGTPTPGTMAWTGGGTPETGTGLTFSTKFDTPESHTVIAKWTCESGESDTDSTTISTTFDQVEVRYKTFIGCFLLETPPNPFLTDFFEGDNRGFGHSLATSRTFQSGVVTIDPAETNGQIGTSSQSFGTTRGYDDDPDGSDVTSITAWCGGLCSAVLAPGATAECTKTATAGSSSNVLTMKFTRISKTEIQLKIDAVGFNPCASIAPAIDVHITLNFRQEGCDNGQLKPMEFRASGNHDGFPWHELYINGFSIFRHNPCLTGEGPSSLFGSGEHSLPGSLNNWQRVPGL